MYAATAASLGGSGEADPDDGATGGVVDGSVAFGLWPSQAPATSIRMSTGAVLAVIDLVGFVMIDPESSALRCMGPLSFQQFGRRRHLRTMYLVCQYSPRPAGTGGGPGGLILRSHSPGFEYSRLAPHDFQLMWPVFERAGDVGQVDVDAAGG